MRRPRLLDLDGFTKEHAQEAPIYFQRRAIRWLDNLRKIGRERGVLPVPMGPVRLDPLDLLRSELNLNNGRALQNVGIALAAARLHPSDAVLFRGTGPVAEISRIIADRDKPGIVGAWSVGHQKVLAARKYLYRRRETMRRSLSQAQRQLVTAGPFRGASILAVPRQPGHLSDLLPVARALRDEHRLDTSFAITAMSLAEQVESEDFMGHVVTGRAGDHRPLLARLSAFVQDEGQRDPTFERVERIAMVRATIQVLEDQLDEALRVASGIGRVMQANLPRMVLAGNPYTLEGRTGARIAAAMGIPTAALEHGSIFPDDPIWQDCSADWVYVWGAASKRALLTCGLAADRIVEAGAPRTDAVVARTTQRKLPIDANILVATSGPGDQVSDAQHRFFIEVLFGAAKMTPALTWIVKLHKKDKSSLYVDETGQKPTNVDVVRGDVSRDGRSIFEYLENARALVTVASTTALDAMMVDVPVITVDVTRGARGLAGIEFLDRGCTTHVALGSDLARAAQKLADGVRDEARDEVARTYVREQYANLGSAASYVASHIADMLSSDSSESGSD